MTTKKENNKTEKLVKLSSDELRLLKETIEGTSYRGKHAKMVAGILDKLEPEKEKE